jgi:hypothetical protein
VKVLIRTVANELPRLAQFLWVGEIVFVLADEFIVVAACAEAEQQYCKHG